MADMDRNSRTKKPGKRVPDLVALQLNDRERTIELLEVENADLRQQLDAARGIIKLIGNRWPSVPDYITDSDFLACTLDIGDIRAAAAWLAANEEGE